MKKKSRIKAYIAIDPGKQGGIACFFPRRKKEPLKVFRCPKTVEEMCAVVDCMVADAKCASDKIYLLVEHVHAFPSDGRSSVFTFGRNLGHWEGIISRHEIEVNTIAPRSWQSFYEVPKIPDKYDRKKWLKNKAIELFPEQKVTFAICDALLLLHYAKENIKWVEQ